MQHLGESKTYSCIILVLLQKEYKFIREDVLSECSHLTACPNVQSWDARSCTRRGFCKASFTAETLQVLLSADEKS